MFYNASVSRWREDISKENYFYHEVAILDMFAIGPMDQWDENSYGTSGQIVQKPCFQV